MTVQIYKNNADDLSTRQSIRLLQNYNNFLCSYEFDIQKGELIQEDWGTVSVAINLIEAAKKMDIAQTFSLLEKGYHAHIGRDLHNPAYYEHDSLINQPWADNPASPLEQGEQWNKGKRIANGGIQYNLDNKGYPVNPHLNYGIEGRGMIGRYGPNHAVDLGILQIRPNQQGQLTLHALGIIRKDSNRPALCGGFTNFEKDDRGNTTYTKKTMVDTQASEFFEELVSGSVTLLPEYSLNLEEEIQAELQKRIKDQQRALSEKESDMIRNQISTHRKLIQVETEDPQFLQNVRDAFNNAHECYTGPVLSSGRNTNNAWMETRLSWFSLDDGQWDQIKGEDKFGYDFIAGDDAASVLWHEITPDLIDTADSHGALFCYLMGSYLMTTQHKNPEILASLKNQADILINHMSGKANPGANPKPTLKV